MVRVWLEYHKARKTSASTEWYVYVSTDELVPIRKIFEPLESTYDPKKTHWTELYDIPEGTIVVRIRRTNRGNIRYDEFTITDEYEGKTLPFS